MRVAYNPALFTGNAEAIYKCTTPKGVVYQDRPCKEGTESDVTIVIPTGELAPKAGAMVEVNSETDFVARNEQFQGIVGSVAKLALDAKGKFSEDRVLARRRSRASSDGGTSSVRVYCDAPKRFRVSLLP